MIDAAQPAALRSVSAMQLSRHLPCFAVILAAVHLATPHAEARFLLPHEGATSETEAKAAAAKLRSITDSKQAEPIFAEISGPASAGSAEALFTIAWLHQSGVGTPQSLEKAKEAYAKAAEKGLAAAQNNLGLLRLATGDDGKAAVALIEQAATAGYAPPRSPWASSFSTGFPQPASARISTRPASGSNEPPPPVTATPASLSA